MWFLIQEGPSLPMGNYKISMATACHSGAGGAPRGGVQQGQAAGLGGGHGLVTAGLPTAGTCRPPCHQAAGSPAGGSCGHWSPGGRQPPGPAAGWGPQGPSTGQCSGRGNAAGHLGTETSTGWSATGTLGRHWGPCGSGQRWQHPPSLKCQQPIPQRKPPHALEEGTCCGANRVWLPKLAQT